MVVPTDSDRLTTMSIPRNSATSNPPPAVHTTHESGFTSTVSIDYVTSTSMGTTDNGQRLTMSQPSPSGINIGSAVGGAVGGLMVVIVVAIGMTVIVLLVVKRGQAHKIPEGEKILASSPDHDVEGYTSIPSIGYSGDYRILYVIMTHRKGNGGSTVSD